MTNQTHNTQSKLSLTTLSLSLSLSFPPSSKRKRWQPPTTPKRFATSWRDMRIISYMDKPQRRPKTCWVLSNGSTVYLHRLLPMQLELRFIKLLPRSRIGVFWWFRMPCASRLLRHLRVWSKNLDSVNKKKEPRSLLCGGVANCQFCSFVLVFKIIIIQ